MMKSVLKKKDQTRKSCVGGMFGKKNRKVRKREKNEITRERREERKGKVIMVWVRGEPGELSRNMDC
jgi:hypothetical protein